MMILQALKLHWLRCISWSSFWPSAGLAMSPLIPVESPKKLLALTWTKKRYPFYFGYFHILMSPFSLSGPTPSRHPFSPFLLLFYLTSTMLLEHMIYFLLIQARPALPSKAFSSLYNFFLFCTLLKHACFPPIVQIPCHFAYRGLFDFFCFYFQRRRFFPFFFFCGILARLIL